MSYIININNIKERLQAMTDFSKYKNITVDHATYSTITKLQTKITPDVKLSRSQVVKTLVNEKARKLNGRLSK
jgi:hypothetical protein